MLTFMLHIHVKPEFETEALNTLLAIEKDANQDKGCIRFNWLRHRDNSYRFTLFEQWENQASLDAHLAKSPDRWNKFLPCLAEEPSSQSFDRVSEISEALADNEVKDFILTWFDKLSRRVSVEEILSMLSPINLTMDFPEITLRGQDEFSRWYEKVGESFMQQEHFLESFDVLQRSPAIELTVNVIWKAQKKEDFSHIQMRANQRWTLEKSSSNEGLMITKYVINSLTPT